MTDCIHCDIAKRYSNPDTKISNTYDILWVGISAKIGEEPLSETTNTGKLVKQIEAACGKPGYKTNLVKCPPVDKNGKLRYPNQAEIDCCFKNLLAEIAEVKPKVVILLGEKVCSAVEKKLNIKIKRWRGFEYFATEYNGIWYLPAQHPSYIYVYKRKEVEKYVEKVAEAIVRIFVDNVYTIFNAVMNTASEKVVNKNKKI